jgi:hypothetical protein
MGSTDHRSADIQQQAHRQAEQARAAMEDKRDGQQGGLSGWVAERAGEWDLSGPDETALQRQKFFWNVLVDYWFRMEIDGWENIGDPPALLVGIHSGPRWYGTPGLLACNGGGGSARNGRCTGRPTTH